MPGPEPYHGVPGRARLPYREWLRRERRRGEAGEQLRTAHGMFGRRGAGGFAGRAGHELQATGETARKRAAAAANQELTAQEAQLARPAGPRRPAWRPVAV